MTVNRVGSGVTPLTDYAKKGNSAKDAKTTSNVANDKLEISKEAKVKSLEIPNTTKLAEVKERIDSGFYNNDGVINSVADAILKEIRGA